MENYLQVEDNPDLVRDTNSKAIINKNRVALEKAKEAKQKRLQNFQDVEMLKSKVDNLDKKMDKILQLLEAK